jgi:hypothetical protein
MPTFEVETRFWNDYRRLSPQQQRSFREARHQFVRVLSQWEAGGW